MSKRSPSKRKTKDGEGPQPQGVHGDYQISQAHDGKDREASKAQEACQDNGDMQGQLGLAIPCAIIMKRRSATPLHCENAADLGGFAIPDNSRAE